MPDVQPARRLSLSAVERERARQQRSEERRRFRQGLTVAEKLGEAERLYREAREHKRLERRYRNRAREAMSRFSEFKADLEAIGIKVEIENINATDAARRQK